MQLVNRILIGLAAIALISVAVCWCVQTIFNSGKSLDNFLASAQTYSGLSVIVQDQIANNLKSSQTSDSIQSASKTVLSPELTEKLLKPSLNNFVGWLQSPAQGSELTLRVDLTQFKDALAEQLSNNSPSSPATQIHFQTVASVPDSVVIVDSQPTSSSTRRFFESLKAIYVDSQRFLPVAATATVGLLLALAVLNVGSLGRIIGRVSWPFALAGALMVIFGFLTPIVIQQLFLKTAPTSIQTAQNFIAAGLLSALAHDLLPYGYLSAAVGVVGILFSKTLLRSAKKKRRHGH